MTLSLLSAAMLMAGASLTTDYLPPQPDWNGASTALMQPTHPWVTPAELSQLSDTPDYATTMQYLQKLVAASPQLRLEVLGQSPQGRDIVLIKASTQPDLVGKSGRPTLLVQAGIHSGEIDGKDAGLMLLRDMTQGKKGHLLEQVDLLFIPILSVDGHERRSAYHRINQRGPSEMGWRSTAENLNLNRDYAKLDSLELRALLKAIHQYQPDLYMDIHVTDGEDYQYDITYGFNEPFASQSPNASSWLASVYRPALDRHLASAGHIPGPLVFALDGMDFSKGLTGSTSTPRFSNGYGDVRHLPTILVENHSLKPYRQRVLGTYVLLEGTMQLLAQQGKVLQLAKKADQNARPARQVLAYHAATQPDPIAFKGVDYKIVESKQGFGRYVQWLGTPKQYDALPVYWEKVPSIEIEVPKAYWIPPQYHEVLERLQWHGIEMQPLANATTMQLQQLSASDPKFSSQPFEGRFMVNASFSAQWQQVQLPVGTVRVSTDQPLGALVVALLQPEAPDSFFSWGFFHGMFQRTEYFERYAFIPWIEQQLAQDKTLQKSLADAMKTDASLAKDADKRLAWLYQQSPFYDATYLKYPVYVER